MPHVLREASGLVDVTQAIIMSLSYYRFPVPKPINFVFGKRDSHANFMSRVSLSRVAGWEQLTFAAGQCFIKSVSDEEWKKMWEESDDPKLS